MPPILATALTLAFVLFLFAHDSARKDDVSKALWLPVFWLAITGSRFVGQWMTLGASGAGIDDGSEGSLIDAVYFSTLILAGGVVLARRQVVGEFVRNNPWLVVVFLYGFAAILWSDFSFIAFKRWIKTLGHPVMALIILTDRDPEQALRIVLKRCAYLLIPTSILFIKYLPEYGRGWDPWSGQAFNKGVGLTKNDLGYLCMVFGLFFFWTLLGARQIEDRRARRWEMLLGLSFLLMIGWLLTMSDSKTSLVALILGAVIIVVVGLPIVNRKLVGTYVVAALVVATVAELAFDAHEVLLAMLGRNATLTDRTEVWADVLALQDSPILGFGFESFWLGPRLEALWAKWPFRPNQAHNGYIETYLNLGAVGCFLYLGLIYSTFRKISREMSTNFGFARLRLAFLFAILAFSFTEAAFKGVHFVWTIFHIIVIEMPRRSPARELGGATGRPPVEPPRRSPATAVGSAKTRLS